MAVTFQSSALQTLYNTGTTTAAALTTFRTGGSTDLDAEIDALDRRIAAFEFVLIGNLPSGQNGSAYPYDRAGLRREFLDELTALLMRRSIDTTPLAINNLYTDDHALVLASSPNGGGVHAVLNKFAPLGNDSFGIFDTLAASANHATVGTDGRLGLLNPAGQAIFRSYSALIDAVFTEGDKLGNNPATPTQSVGAIQPLTVDTFTYDRIAQVSGVATITTGTPPTSTQVPSYETYLLSADAPESRVTKDSSGNVALTGPATTTAPRLRLNPLEAPPIVSGSTLHSVVVDGTTLFINIDSTGISAATGTFTPRTTATEIPTLLLNIPGRGHEFPDARIAANQRVTTANGVTYLIGLGSDGKVYATSLAPANRAATGATASLNSLEYLLFFNEARIKILRGKLAYNEAVVREIQEDLRRANEALAALETQAGVIIATDSSGALTNQTSPETTEMNLFNAMHSTAGNGIFSLAGADSIHTSAEWQQNRTNLKNYIDRRSAEAQQATLDYQNTLNRFNNAFEVMAKLQEKLDTLLKAQLRNLS